MIASYAPQNKKGASIFKSLTQLSSKSERPLAPKAPKRFGTQSLPLDSWFFVGKAVFLSKFNI